MLKNNEIIISTLDGLRKVSKEEIIRGLMSFDSREPDKTLSLWQDVAKRLYQSQEIITTFYQ